MHGTKGFEFQPWKVHGAPHKTCSYSVSLSSRAMRARIGTTVCAAAMASDASNERRAWSIWGDAKKGDPTSLVTRWLALLRVFFFHYLPVCCPSLGHVLRFQLLKGSSSVYLSNKSLMLVSFLDIAHICTPSPTPHWAGLSLVFSHQSSFYQDDGSYLFRVLQ